MNEQKYTYRVQWLVLIASALLFLLLLGTWINEGRTREWRHHQRAYISILNKMDTSAVASAGESIERGIFQVNLPQLNRVDRCISCHQGLEDPRMKEIEQPHTAHPGNFLVDHPVQQYGCTICHGGQGGALSRVDAFGRLPETHWPFPLLEQPYIQSSCGKCHLSIFNASAMAPSADGSQTLEGEMEGMEVFLRGKVLFSEEGCLGCHKARGVGGFLGPDLTEQGEKTRHEYSFQNIRGEQTISNWLKEHFKDPEMVSPGSQMLKINLDENQLEGLATFVMGLEKPEIPFEYFTMETLNEFKGIREPFSGTSGYAYLCSGCHGKQGEGKRYEDFKTGTPSIGNNDFLRVASEEFLHFTLEKGRSLRQMGSWNPALSGLKDIELESIVRMLKQQSLKPAGSMDSYRRGDPGKGGLLFEKHCTTCHGTNGKGGVALALNQEGFLGRASDQFIIGTMVNGRGNTAMPGWSHLGTGDLGHILSHMRSWRLTPLFNERVVLPEADVKEGALKYHFLCSRCHGESGKGETGPAIINRDFLDLASDSYLHNTIAEGRAHTAMFGWSADVYNQEKLMVQDISNIIGYMRVTSESPLTYIFQGSNPGDRERGAAIFAEKCVKCHGASGEGLKAPALNNQEFLSAASNGYLLATITLGRSNTAMPPWGYGLEDYPALTGKEREDLVSWIRSWQRIRIRY